MNDFCFGTGSEPIVLQLFFSVKRDNKWAKSFFSFVCNHWGSNLFFAKYHLNFLNFFFFFFCFSVWEDKQPLKSVFVSLEFVNGNRLHETHFWRSAFSRPTDLRMSIFGQKSTKTLTWYFQKMDILKSVGRENALLASFFS